MRLRNRQIKATCWTDGELLRWSRDKREYYRSLWACAEDSCCIIDDMFELKMTAWPSPMDADMSVDRLEQWRDELVEAEKLIPYTVNGRRYFFLPAMAKNERPRNPQAPDWPLPAWVEYQTSGDGRNRRCVYVFGDWRCPKASVQPLSGNRNTSVQSDEDRPEPQEEARTTVRSASGNRSGTVRYASGSRNTSPVLSCPALPSPVQSVREGESTHAAFADAWKAYPVHRYREQAELEFDNAVAGGADPADIIAACNNVPRSTTQSLGFFLADGTWRDHVPKRRREPCVRCRGTGVIELEDGSAAPCPDCHTTRETR